MGYAVPSVGYAGYTASDTELAAETTEYSTTETTYTTKQTLTELEDIRVGSKFRIKFEIKNSNGAPATSYCRAIDQNTDTELNSLSDQGFAYEAKEFDVEYLGGTIAIQIKTSSGDECFIKNLSICGDPTPMIWG